MYEGAVSGESFGFSEAGGRFSQAWELALKKADAFVSKATNALFEGDTDRAAFYVSKAAAIPFEEDDNFFPGVWQAEYRLADFVLTTLAETPEGDETWLAAVHDVLGDSKGVRTALLQALAVVLRDGDLTHSERKHVNALLDGAPAYDLDAPAHDHATPEVDRQNRIDAAITALIAYAAALA